MNNKINKSKLNLAIDIIMFVVLMAIAGIGFMIKYILVPGFKRNEIYRRDVELYFWGFDRHEWGSIHLILSFVLLFLLLLHIVFHWKQIVCIFKGMVTVKAWRIALTSVVVIVSLLFGVVPLFVNPEIEESIPHHFQTSHAKEKTGQGVFSFTLQSDMSASDTVTSINSLKDISNNKTKPKKNYKHKNKNDIEVYGSMTLDEVATKYKVSAAELAKYIHVPKEYTNEKLGRLRKQYGFHMDDLRNYIKSKNKQ